MVIIKLLTISTFTISIFNIWVILHFLQLPYFASPEIWRILFDFRQLFHYEPKYSKVVKSIKFIELTCESMPQLVFTCYIQAYLGPSEELLDNIKTYTSLVFSFLAICIGIMDVVHTGTIHKWYFSLNGNFIFVYFCLICVVAGIVTLYSVFWSYLCAFVFFFMFTCLFLWFLVCIIFVYVCLLFLGFLLIFVYILSSVCVYVLVSANVVVWLPICVLFVTL